MMRRLILISLLLLTTVPVAVGQDTSAQQSRKKQLEKEIALIEQQLKENKNRNANALNTLSLVRKKLSTRKSRVSESDREIEALTDSIETGRAQIAALQSRLDTLDLYYARLVRNAYKNRDSRVWYMYILASDNIGQASRRYGYLKSLSSQMNVQATRIKSTKTEIEEKLEQQRQMKEKAEKLREERKLDLDRIVEEEKQSNDLIAQLGKEKQKYQNQLASRKKQVEALNNEIARIIAAEQRNRKKNSAKTGSGNAGDLKLSADFEANKGKLPWPCEGTILEHFGQHNHPVYTNIVMPFNNGVNVGVPEGTKVKAVFDGEVRKVIVMPGYNKCILVQHGGYYTFYCKMASVDVKAGDKLSTGQVIGTVDTIDGQTQLHFQLWKESTPEDPEKWLRR